MKIGQNDLVLVTGCQGFSGQEMVRFLVSEGHQVVGLDQMPAPPTAGIRVIASDLRSQEDVDRAIQQVQPQCIVHLAAATDRAEADPVLLSAVNFQGTLNLLDAVTRYTPGAHVCVVGSSAEYGWTIPKDCPLREDHRLQPVSVYGITKVAQSMVAQRAWLKDRVHVTRTRTFNLIGPGQPDSLAPGAFARQIAEAEVGLRPPVVVTGRLSDYRDFIDVRDATRAYWMIAERGEPGQVYNVCSGRAIQVRQILDLLLDLATCEIRVQTTERPDFKSMIPYQYGTHELLSTHTGWQPKINLEQSVRDLLDYWREKVRNLQHPKEQDGKSDSI